MSSTTANRVERGLALEMLERMWLIRRFDEAANRLLQAGHIPGVIHLTTGQEGEVVGSCMALEREDYIVGHHRSHGHPIAKGADVGPLMAELMGKATGVCKGKGGSQHLMDAAVGNFVGSAVLASAMPLAVGAGLTSRMKGTGRVVLCLFGDGAANEGAVHESMNLAAIWQAPVIFLCENNGYAVTVSAEYAGSVEHVADRAPGYGMPGQIIDGQDVLAVHDAVAAAAARARAGGGPSLIEVKTYRICDHAENLPIGPYRSKDEVDRWRKRDPIELFRAHLLAEGIASEEDAVASEAHAHKTVEDAVEFALQSPYPSEDELFTDLFAEPHPAPAIQRTAS